MTTLRLVLEAFENAERPLRLDDLSRSLRVDPATLDNMIQYWVRKGRIRADNGPDQGGCSACGVKGHCPFVVQLPRRYILVRSGDPLEVSCGENGACCPAGKHRH